MMVGRNMHKTLTPDEFREAYNIDEKYGYITSVEEMLDKDRERLVLNTICDILGWIEQQNYKTRRLK